MCESRKNVEMSYAEIKASYDVLRLVAIHVHAATARNVYMTGRGSTTISLWESKTASLWRRKNQAPNYILDDEIVYSRQEIVWPFMRQCTVATYIKYIQRLLIKSKKLSLVLVKQLRLSVVCKILQRKKQKSLQPIRVALVIIPPGMLLSFTTVVPLTR